MSEACAETAVWPRDQLIVSLTDFHRLPLVLTVSRPVPLVSSRCLHSFSFLFDSSHVLLNQRPSLVPLHPPAPPTLAL